MPFADGGGMLAVGFGEVRDGEPLRCDERGGELAHDSGLEIGAPMVAARQERVTGGGNRRPRRNVRP